MKDIKINSSKEYNVYVNSGSPDIYPFLDIHKIKSIFIITDKNILKFYSKFINSINDKIVGSYVIEPGEKSKSDNTILNIYYELMKSEVNRKTTIIAIGGGVVGDTAGFIASTFMRGIGIVHVPTTLIAQCDSSIGGKNGFNLGNLKNIVGTFYQPRFVYTNVNFLKTLSEREYINGLAEVIKYGYVLNRNLFNYIEENKRGIKEREIDKLLHIVSECVKIKGTVVEKDEFDVGVRNILNFGHTIGHGIESSSNFNISHGEGVSIGMNIESAISNKMGYLSQEDYNRLINILQFFKLPISMENADTNKILEYIKKDKKKTTNDIKFVLPDRLGHAIITTEVKQDTVTKILKEKLR